MSSGVLIDRPNSSRVAGSTHAELDTYLCEEIAGCSAAVESQACQG